MTGTATPKTVSVGQVAAVLDLEVRRVQQLAREGIIPKPARGRYQLGGCVQGYIRYLRARAHPDDLLTYDAARTKKMTADAELAELTLARERGRLVEVERFESALSQAFGRVRSRLLALPSRAAPDLVGLAAEVDAELVLDRLVVEMLAELQRDPVPDDDSPAPSQEAP